MEENSNVHDKLFELLFAKDEVTWQTMLYELVKSEEMDPWNINISTLSERFLHAIHMRKEMDLRVSGKAILAAAILLKIKSNRLVGEDISNLDRLFAQSDEEDTEEGLLDELVDDFKHEREVLTTAELIPRTPQPRKRKVSIYDLVGALQKAMDVKKRRDMREIPSIEMEVPEKKRDISEVIGGVFKKISVYFSKNQKKRLTFTELLPSESKQSRVHTFIPLLHLTNQRKIDLFQYRHFGEIEIELLKQKAEVNKELSESA